MSKRTKIVVEGVPTCERCGSTNVWIMGMFRPNGGGFDTYEILGGELEMAWDGGAYCDGECNTTGSSEETEVEIGLVEVEDNE